MSGLSCFGVVVCALLTAAPAANAAEPSPSHDASEEAIRQLVDRVAAYEGVPSDVLYAMAQAESGVSADGAFSPWPWSLNVAGEARRYDSREAMFDDLMTVLGEGTLRVDIGLMQINWYWQFERVNSPWRITEPAHNLKIAAQILVEQYRIHGNWREAVGRYHRPADGEEHRAIANQYQERVYRLLEAATVRKSIATSHRLHSQPPQGDSDA
ncbi:MAG: transglycosylase SLT domain-containing protein [Pseudomonadota bacterium]